MDAFTLLPASFLFSFIGTLKVRSSHRRCSIKKLFLEISQNSQESTCARASYNKVAGRKPATLL